MDLKQRKLNKSEWETIEVPVSTSEMNVLNMIIKGYNDVNIKINNNNSIFSYLKIEFTEKMEGYLFNAREEFVGTGIDTTACRSRGSDIVSSNTINNFAGIDGGGSGSQGIIAGSIQLISKAFYKCAELANLFRLRFIMNTIDKCFSFFACFLSNQFGDLPVSKKHKLLDQLVSCS